MNDRVAAFIEFNLTFVRYSWAIRETIVSLLLLILLGGWVISIAEEIKLGDAIYFAFITGLSIGYGDIAPITGLGRVVSVAIGLTGMVFVGLSVAVGTRALRVTVAKHDKNSK